MDICNIFTVVVAMNGNNDNLLLEICVSIVNSDKKVSFAGVVDSNGKLLGGKCRENENKRQYYNGHHDKPPFYYFHLVTSGLTKWKHVIETDCSNTSKLQFNVLELGGIKLAIAQLTKGSQSYLCIQIDPSMYFGKIISKICKCVNIPRISKVTSL
jgi:hypothetical protein